MYLINKLSIKSSSVLVVVVVLIIINILFNQTVQCISSISNGDIDIDGGGGGGNTVDRNNEDAIVGFDLENNAAVVYTNNSGGFLATISKDETSAERIIDIFLFTQYCGPSNRFFDKISHPIYRTPIEHEQLLSKKATKIGGIYQLHKQQQQQQKQEQEIKQQTRLTYAELDVCCKQHDSCQNYIVNREDYQQFPGLSYKGQLFTRLQCSCDAMFYKCLDDLNSRYANAVAIGYGIVQTYCFDLQYPIIRCSKWGLRRCEEYLVDNTQEKKWQWFDVPSAYKKIFHFPRTINLTSTTTP